ncbi:MAG: hotdog fold thioesterase [Actinomycetota bacterium]
MSDAETESGSDRSPAEVSAAMHAADRVAHELGMSIDHADVGVAAVSMTVTEVMCNGLGVCHGGILFTLADTAMAHASNAGGERTLSTTASIEWIRAASVGDRLTARSSILDRRGRNTIHDIDVVNQGGERVAIVRGQTLTLGGSVAP